MPNGQAEDCHHCVSLMIYMLPHSPSFWQDTAGTIVFIDLKHGCPLGQILRQDTSPALVCAGGDSLIIAYGGSSSTTAPGLLAVFKTAQIIRELCPAISSLDLVQVSTQGGRCGVAKAFVSLSSHIYLSYTYMRIHQDRHIRTVFTLMSPEVRRQSKAPDEYKEVSGLSDSIASGEPQTSPASSTISGLESRPVSTNSFNYTCKDYQRTINRVKSASCSIRSIPNNHNLCFEANAANQGGLGQNSLPSMLEDGACILPSTKTCRWVLSESSLT